MVLGDHTMAVEVEDVVDAFPVTAHLLMLLLLLRIPLLQLCAINVVSPAILRLSAPLTLAPPLGHNNNVQVRHHLHAPHSLQHVDMLRLPRRRILALVLQMARVMHSHVWHVASWTLPYNSQDHEYSMSIGLQCQSYIAATTSSTHTYYRN